jgi:predicted nucleotidyltransferase
MYVNKKPTPYIDVNQVLHHFFLKIQVVLGSRFIGMYLYGSLACGDFNHDNSDIDIIVVYKDEIDDERFSMLKDMHAEFDAKNSPWAQRVEIAYISEEALLGTAPKTALYPQIEKGGPLKRLPLELGWAFQSYSLHEFGLIVAGSDPRMMANPVDLKNLKLAALNITKIWVEQSHQDSWIQALQQKNEQAFVVLSLCRFLYTHRKNTIGSKSKAARWAMESLDRKWTPLIERSLKERRSKDKTLDSDLESTLKLLQYTSITLSSS